MGICDSTNDTNKNINNNINLKTNKIFEDDNDKAKLFSKYNIDTDNIELLKKKNNGYILPIILEKKDKIENYYFIIIII